MNKLIISTALLPLALVISLPSQAGSIVIDFEGLPPGTIITELTKGAGFNGTANGKISVVGHNTIFPATNAAVVFDSLCTGGACTGGDWDLGTPNETLGGPGVGVGGEIGSPYENNKPLGNIAILAENLNDGDGDGLVDNPDDADVLGYINLDFTAIKKGKSSTVTVSSVTMIDVEWDEGESPALIELTGPGILPATFAINNTDDNGVVTFDGINLSGVTNMRVNLKGSGAMVSAALNVRAPGSCWITTGGFQNAGFTSGSKDYTFGGNVGPPPSGSWQVIDHSNGDNFHSNDVHIVDCIEIDGTGPGQPGGKKGFTINQAFFAGTGRLNGVDGYPFTGYVIDRGEPSGKNGNDTDEYSIVVRNPDSNVIVFEATAPLDGGNVQIHPPTGSQK